MTEVPAEQGKGVYSVERCPCPVEGRVVKRSARVRSRSNLPQYRLDKICKRPTNSLIPDISAQLSFSLPDLLTMHSHSSAAPCPPKALNPAHPRPHLHNGHSPDKTQAFQPVAPGWDKQTEHGSCGPSACSPQPFPSLAPKQMTSSAGPSSYQPRGLPGTPGGKEPGGRGWPELWLLWHSLGLCGVSVAAFKSALALFWGFLQPPPLPAWPT